MKENLTDITVKRVKPTGFIQSAKDPPIYGLGMDSATSFLRRSLSCCILYCLRVQYNCEHGLL